MQLQTIQDGATKTTKTEGGNVKKVVLIGVLMLYGVANADDPHCRTEVLPYHRSATKSKTVLCNSGDRAIGGGAVCPHSFYLTRSSWYQDPTTGQEGWSAYCAKPGVDPAPTTIDVVCLESVYIPAEYSTCFLKPGHEGVSVGGIQ